MLPRSRQIAAHRRVHSDPQLPRIEAIIVTLQGNTAIAKMKEYCEGSLHFTCQLPAFQTLSRELQSSEPRQLRGPLELFLTRSHTSAVGVPFYLAGYVEAYLRGCFPARCLLSWLGISICRASSVKNFRIASPASPLCSAFKYGADNIDVFLFSICHVLTSPVFARIPSRESNTGLHNCIVIEN